MRAVVQRVDSAMVTVRESPVAAIGAGLLVFLGIGHEDGERDAEYLADKIVNLRIFSDAAGKMNLSLLDIGGQMLVVSQFTLFGDCRKGRRPGFDAAAPPEQARRLYEYFIIAAGNRGIEVKQGQFQAEMKVALINDGPVTMLIDSRRLF